MTPSNSILLRLLLLASSMKRSQELQGEIRETRKRILAEHGPDVLASLDVGLEEMRQERRDQCSEEDPL